MLTQSDALDVANGVLSASADEAHRLDNVARYLDGTYPASVYIPSKVQNRAAGREYAGVVARSRQPVLSLVVDALAQNLYVDGYRSPRSATDAESWAHWQANRMDARQAGINRGVISFGGAYLTILPGSPVPVWRPVSARRMCAMYGDRLNDEWPLYALEQWVEGLGKTQRRRFRLYDDEQVYELGGEEYPAGTAMPSAMATATTLLDVSDHNTGVCPTVRFVGSADLDGECIGEVQPLIPFQNQIDSSTYHIEMAQIYAVHRQRWVTGMAIPEDDDGNPLMPFDIAVDHLLQGEEPDTKFGEFGQTEIKSWLDAREASLRGIAIKSQTPPGYMLGEMANLSAEALAATEAPAQRRSAGYRSLLGESYEQAFRLDARQSGDEAGWANPTAQVVWRDTESRSLAQVADALGKLATSLQIPARGLWEKIPGATDQDLARWEQLREEGMREAADMAARSFGVDVGTREPVES